MIEVNENNFPYFFIGFLILYRAHAYRYFRPYVPYVLVAFFIPRFYGKIMRPCCEKESLLVLFEKWLASFHSVELNFIVQDLLAIILFVQLYRILYVCTTWNFHELYKTATDVGFDFVKQFSFVKSMLKDEEVKLEKSMDHDMKTKTRAIGPSILALPDKGLSHQEILNLISSSITTENSVWQNGKLSGSVYGGDRKHIEFLNECFSYYSIANVLHPDIWPSVMKYESEIIMMAASLVNGGCSTVCGSTTSGGTESIILAVKSHRDYYRQQFNITQPEIVACFTAHPALEKACDILGITLKKVAYDSKTFRVNLNYLQQMITSNTIMMYSSAPNYPMGAIDPIKEMSAIAVKYNIGLHVDCCLGGFILPFAKRLGYNIPDFDFGLKGVTSMSMDTHKYGYALKGTSVVLYRHKELRHAQYFCYGDWPGGLYSTPTLLGSRSGGLIAQTWASLMSLGHEGFNQCTKGIMDTTALIHEGLKKIPEIEVLGDIDAMILCFGMTIESKLNIYMISELMKEKGWLLNAIQQPAAVHFCICNPNIGHHERFLTDLKAAIHELQHSPDKEKKGFAVIYGTTSAMPAGPVNELLKVYNDVVLKV